MIKFPSIENAEKSLSSLQKHHLEKEYDFFGRLEQARKSLEEKYGFEIKDKKYISEMMEWIFTDIEKENSDEFDTKTLKKNKVFTTKVALEAKKLLNDL